jgi:hypothetical protein
VISCIDHFFISFLFYFADTLVDLSIIMYSTPYSSRICLSKSEYIQFITLFIFDQCSYSSNYQSNIYTTWSTIKRLWISTINNDFIFRFHLHVYSLV